MTWTPNEGHVQAKQKEDARKDDEVFVAFAGEVLRQTLKPEMTDEQIEKRMQMLWQWWNAP